MGGLAHLYAAYAFWIWMAVGAALLATEVHTGSGWLLWPAASAAVTAILLTVLGLSAPWALALFAGLTIVSTLTARRYLPRGLLTAHGEDINDNVGRLVGREGRAVVEFAHRRGRVFIDGKEWAAELEDDEACPQGALVRVSGVHGARLTVRAGWSTQPWPKPKRLK